MFSTSFSETISRALKQGKLSETLHWYDHLCSVWKSSYIFIFVFFVEYFYIVILFFSNSYIAF